MALCVALYACMERGNFGRFATCIVQHLGKQQMHFCAMHGLFIMVTKHRAHDIASASMG